MNEQALRKTAHALVAPGKGILAIDESTGTIKKRFDSIGVESTVESRRGYRELLITVPEGGRYVSGMILYDETLRQATAAGEPFPAALRRQGMLPGIKVDAGTRALAGAPGELVTEGLDGLRDRLAEYAGLGAAFAKWRAVITIGAAMPTAWCIEANAHALARYAGLYQEAGLVPIVEPEVLMDGDHSIERCYDVTRDTLNTVFQAIHRAGVRADLLVLKASMVIAGTKAKRQAGADEVASLTVDCLRRTVPSAVPGIVFLSGGQDEITATANLDAMNRKGPHPWPLSFSFGRALQAPALKTWKGEAANVAAAQRVLAHREHMNSLACHGTWTPDAEKAPAGA